jgi:hypothetical protein
MAYLRSGLKCGIVPSGVALDTASRRADRGGVIFSLCALVFVLRLQSPPAAQPLFELPPGDAAAAVAALQPSTSAHPTPKDLGASGTVPTLPRGAWSEPATWSAWSTQLLAEAGAARANKAPDAERRARLALLALEQGRSDDAWAHFAATRTDPTWSAAVLPRFLPGVPSGSPGGKGGLPGPLPDGAVLAPSLPPPSADRAAGRIDRRAMSVRAITVGAAVVSLRVSVETEGVQIDVRHVSGGAAKLSVLIPESPDWQFGNEYVDWYRQETMRVPHAIEVKPGEEEHTIYGRFETQQPRRFTAGLPASMPAQIASGGLWLSVRADDAEKPSIEAAAQAISAVLSIRCRVRAPGAAPGWTGTSVDLEKPEERAAKLVWLASAVERFALAPAGPR